MADSNADTRILVLFEDAGEWETLTPGVRAWLARDASDAAPRPILIKRVDGGKGRATAALFLRHPHIVPTRRWLAGEGGGALYVVRDAVMPGQNLREALAPENAGRSAGAVRRLFLPILDALAHAHGAGLAHGGLSAENVLVGADGAVVVSDWATADPKAPQHLRHYNGTASAEGDLRALRALIAEFLPTTGAFARAAMRARIAGIVGRCDTLPDLRETVNALERLAAAPLPAAPLPAAEETGGRPRLSWTLPDNPIRVPQRGGVRATLVVRNEGEAPLVLRRIATQRSWLNVQPIVLPVTIGPGHGRSVPFAVSAALLTPGEHRSEVYLSANAPGGAVEDSRGGWFKHTLEMRITVDAGPTSPRR